MSRMYKLNEETTRDCAGREHRLEVFRRQDYYVLHLDGEFYSTGDCMFEVLSEIRDIKCQMSLTV